MAANNSLTLLPSSSKHPTTSSAVWIAVDGHEAFKIERGRFFVPITLGPKGTSFTVLLDSGSDVFTLHPSDAGKAGISFDNSQLETLRIIDCHNSVQDVQGKWSELTSFTLDANSPASLSTTFFVSERVATLGQPILCANALYAAILLAGKLPSFSFNLRPIVSADSPGSPAAEDDTRFIPVPDASLQKAIASSKSVAEAIEANTRLPGILDPKRVIVTLPLRSDVRKDKVVTSKGYRAVTPKSPEAKQALTDQIDSWLKDGVLKEVDRTSVKCFNRVLVIRQKDKFRICLDSVHVNSLCDPDNDQRLPLFEDVWAKVANSGAFVTLDGQSLYTQACVHPDSQPYLAIEHDNRAYVFARCPFGLSFLPGLFQRVLDDLLKDLPGAAGYIDDVIISGDSPDVVSSRLLTFLGRANDLGWKVSWKKACLGASSVRFLGSIISKDGRAIDPDKVTALKAIPQPTTLKSLQHYLGFCNFLRVHVIKFADEVGPLLDVLRSTLRDPKGAKASTKLEWTQEATTAFSRLTAALETGAFIGNYNPNLPLLFYTDASDVGVSAVVAQRSDDNSTLITVGLESRSLTSAERMYSAFKREALAIIYALRKWRKHILMPVTFYTDNQGLSFLSGSVGSERLPPSWLDELALQSITFVWVPGQLNAAADHLSRFPSGIPGTHASLLELMEPTKPSEYLAPGASGLSWARSQAFRATSSRSSEEAQALSINSLEVIASVSPSQVAARAARQDRALRFARRTDKTSAGADMIVKGLTPSTLITPTTGSSDSTATTATQDQPTPTTTSTTTSQSTHSLSTSSSSPSPPSSLESSDAPDGASLDWPTLAAFRTPASVDFAQGPIPGTLMPGEEHRAELVRKVHSDMGHRSAPAMLWALRSVAKLSWPGMRSECFDVAQSCAICSKRNRGQDAYSAAHSMDPVAPMHTVYVDVAGPFTPSPDGLTYLLVLVDHLTSFCWLRPVKDLKAATLVTEILAIFYDCGFPSTLHADAASYFKSEEFEGVFSRFEVETRFSASKHQSSNGAVERKISDVKSTLLKVFDDRKIPIASWYLWVGAIQALLNAAPSRVTQASPFQLFTGRPFRSASSAQDAASMIGNSLADVPPAFADKETADDWLQHLHHHFDSVVPEIRKRIIEIHSRQTQHLDSKRSTDRPLKDGDFVRIKKRTDDSNLAKALPTWSDEVFVVSGTDGHGNHTLTTLQGRGVPQVYPRHLLKNVRKPQPDSTSASGDSNDSTLPPITSIVQKLPLRDGKQWYVVRRKGLVTTFEVEASELGSRRRHEFDKRLRGEAKQ